MKNSCLVFALCFLFILPGGLWQDDVRAASTGASVHVTGIADAEITACVTPGMAYSGKYIIRPRCDNINLVLRCPPNRPGTSPNTAERMIKPIQVVERAVGIECPPLTPCPDSDPSCKQDHIDVVRVANASQTLCVTCPLPSRFDLSPESLGLKKERREGKRVACSVEGRYNTHGFSDPIDADPGFVPMTGDLCRETTGADKGRILLAAIAQTIDSINVCLDHPVGLPIQNTPWLTDCGPPSTIGPPLGFLPFEGFSGIDDDGFPDYAETGGFPLPSDMTLAGSNLPGGISTRISPCGGPAGPDRVFCMDYNTQDLFAILHPLIASSTLFPFMDSTADLKGFFSQVSAPKGAGGGLGVTVHALNQTSMPAGSKTIAHGQAAVRIEEQWIGFELPITRKTQIELGTSDFGTPNSAGNVKVYTKRIKQYICDLCGGEPQTDGSCAGYDLMVGDQNCKSSTGLTGKDLLDRFSWYVNQHEVGHSIYLATPWDPGLGNHHEPDGNYTRIMEPSWSYSKKGSRVTIFLPDEYCSACQSDPNYKYRLE